jgi:hypothetical protein
MVKIPIKPIALGCVADYFQKNALKDCNCYE